MCCSAGRIALIHAVEPATIIVLAPCVSLLNLIMHREADQDHEGGVNNKY